MLKKRTFARLPRTAYQPDLLESVGRLQKSYPIALRSWTCFVDHTLYRLLATGPGKYRIYKNKAIVATFSNEYTSLQEFKTLMKKHDSCIKEP